MKAPCKDCTDRSISCHGICPKYRVYIEENDRVKAARASDPSRLICDYNYDLTARLRAMSLWR